MKSYLRFLSRNKLYTAIEVVGLSVALAFVILMGCFVWQQGSVGRQYPDFKRIYCAGYCNSTFSSVRFSNIISGQIPEIEQTVNIVLYEGLMDESIGRCAYMAVSPDFFEMFPCRFIAGNHDALEDVSNVIITESMAEKFAHRISVPLWVFPASLAFVLAVTILLVTLRSLRSARTNPAETLKKE